MRKGVSVRVRVRLRVMGEAQAEGEGEPEGLGAGDGAPPLLACWASHPSASSAPTKSLYPSIRLGRASRRPRTCEVAPKPKPQKGSFLQ